MRLTGTAASVAVLALTLSACDGGGAALTGASVTVASATSVVSESITSAPRPLGKTKVVVDYSPTVSDVGALLYLLSHPNVDVVAVTLPVTGEAGCNLGVDVTLRILALLGRDSTPVACGLEMPAGAKPWPAGFLDGQEFLAFGLPEPAGRPSDLAPHDLIAEVVATTPDPVVLLAVGPLTNVAQFLDRYPDAAAGIERIVIMGGAVESPGNVEGARAEWNIWVDIAAAADVIASGVPLTMVPLDATNAVPVPNGWQTTVDRAAQTPSIEYLGELVRTFPAVTSGFFYLWDELAATVAAGEGLVTSEERTISVVEVPGQDLGRTVLDPAGPPVVVGSGVPDPEGFYEHFLSTLAGAPVALDE